MVVSQMISFQRSKVVVALPQAGFLRFLWLEDFLAFSHRLFFPVFSQAIAVLSGRLVFLVISQMIGFQQSKVVFALPKVGFLSFLRSQMLLAFSHKLVFLVFSQASVLL